MNALQEKFKKSLQGSLNDLKAFNWNDLNDPSTVGVWPGPVRLLLAVVLFVACLGLGYWFHIKDLQAELDKVAGEESGLKADLESKAVLASNLEAYRQQMMDMDESFGDLLRQLPGQTEVAGLLDDINFTGLGSGLEFSNIALDKEVSREFYIELPINISVIGGYHDFGAFVSGVSSLSRIVTLHDFVITAPENRSALQMKITARTYRYKSAETKKTTGEAK